MIFKKRRKVLSGDVLTESQEFIANLDRTKLGSYAVDEYLLSLCDFYERATAYIKYSKHIDMESINLRSAVAATELNKQIENTPNITIHDVRGELAFWWSKYDEAKFLPSIYNNRSTYLTEEKLHKLYNNPKFHSYFAAGIWDISEIKRYIANGIDASLAANLIAS